MSETLQERYQRNADATGHAPDCRRRIVPTITSDHRALDVERCARCRMLAGKLKITDLPEYEIKTDRGDIATAFGIEAAETAARTLLDDDPDADVALIENVGRGVYGRVARARRTTNGTIEFLYLQGARRALR